MVPHHNRGYPGDAGPAFSRGGIPYPMECDPFNKPEIVAEQAPIFGTAMELLIFRRNWLDWLPQVHAGPAPALVEVASFKSKPLPMYQDISIAWRKTWNMCTKNTKTVLVHRTKKQKGATSKMEVPNHQDIQVIVFFPFYLL